MMWEIALYMSLTVTRRKCRTFPAFSRKRREACFKREPIVRAGTVWVGKARHRERALEGSSLSNARGGALDVSRSPARPKHTTSSSGGDRCTSCGHHGNRSSEAPSRTIGLASGVGGVCVQQPCWIRNRSVVPPNGSRTKLPQCVCHAVGRPAAGQVRAAAFRTLTAHRSV